MVRIAEVRVIVVGVLFQQSTIFSIINKELYFYYGCIINSRFRIFSLDKKYLLTVEKSLCIDQP